MIPCTLTLSDLDLEDIFHNDFEQDISEEDRVHILAMVTRLHRILDWDPGNEERLFQRIHGPEIIRDILQHFARWKEYVNESDSLDTVKRQHLMIYSLAKLSVFYWIKDSDIIAEILREVYECDGHFSSMFSQVVNRYDKNTLWRRGTYGDDDSKKKEDTATAFFVYHAHKAKLEFKGVRFIDLRLRYPLTVPPVCVAAIYNRPHLLLYFLRHGAKIEFIPNGAADDWNLPMLLRHLIRILWNSLGENLYHLDFCSSKCSTILSHTMCNVAESFRVLLRVIPQIKMGEITFLLMKFNSGVLSGSVSSHDFIRLLSEKGLVPSLVRRYLEPSELRHLCRCVIRNVLNRYWNLPYGINRLHLPKLLKQYLSLLED